MDWILVLSYGKLVFYLSESQHLAYYIKNLWMVHWQPYFGALRRISRFHIIHRFRGFFCREWRWGTECNILLTDIDHLLGVIDGNIICWNLTLYPARDLNGFSTLPDPGQG